MRVLHLANSYFFAGRLLAGKLAGLQALGYFVEVAAPPPTGQAPSLPCPFHPLPMARSIRPGADLASLCSCVKLLRSGRYDAVHTHSSKAGLIGRAAARICGVPCLHSVHGLPFYQGQNPFAYAFFRELELFAGRRTDLLLTQNREEQRLLRALLPGHESRILYEGNGLDLSLAGAFAKRRSAARKALGLLPTDVALAFFCRTEPVKRPLDFLRAFEQAHRQNPALKAILAGADLGRGARCAREFGCALQASPAKAAIRCLGFLTEPLAVLCGCDAAVLTSEKEGLPRILMEAMALGLPCAATDVTGTRELVSHGTRGLLSPLGDTGALAKHLLLLANDPALRQKLGQNARAYAERELDERLVIDRIARAYDLLMELTQTKALATTDWEV